MTRPLAGIRACVFDAFGTLFDTGSAAEHSRPILGDATAALAALWREKQLDYTWLRGLQNRHESFDVVTAEALDWVLDTLKIDQPGLRQTLLTAYASLAAYPDVRPTLERLRMAGITTAILSNGSPGLLAGLVAAAGLDGLFDHVLSVEEVGVFKPHPSVYRLACDRLSLPPSEISFQSSNGWDAYAASAFGLRVIWCNRSDQAAERLPGKPDAVIRRLDEMCALVLPANP